MKAELRVGKEVDGEAYGIYWCGDLPSETYSDGINDQVLAIFLGYAEAVEI